MWLILQDLSVTCNSVAFCTNEVFHTLCLQTYYISQHIFKGWGLHIGVTAKVISTKTMMKIEMGFIS